jgi:hypothetical protein
MPNADCDFRRPSLNWSRTLFTKKVLLPKKIKMSDFPWTAMQDALLIQAAHDLDFSWIQVTDRVKCKDKNECKKR